MARWIKPLIAEAASRRTRLPWERGLRRAASIARRAAPPREAARRHEAAPLRRAS